MSIYSACASSVLRSSCNSISFGIEMRETTPPSTTNNNNRTHACNRNRFSPFLLSRRRHHPIRISTTTQRLERTNERTNQDIFVSSSPGSRFVLFCLFFFEYFSLMKNRTHFNQNLENVGKLSQLKIIWIFLKIIWRHLRWFEKLFKMKCFQSNFSQVWLLMNQLEKKTSWEYLVVKEKKWGECNKKSEKSMGRTSESTGVVGTV